MSETIPNLAHGGWSQRIDCGGGVFILEGFGDTPSDRPDMAVEHTCTRQRDGLTVVCSPFLSPGHRVVNADPLTITPSILCGDCGLHGFITQGRWSGA